MMVMAIADLSGRGFAVAPGLADELGGAVRWHSSTHGTTAELVFPHIIEEIQA